MTKELSELYQLHQKNIKEKLREFRNISEKHYFQELLFCLLTPQSNARRCWEAVQEIQKLKKQSSTAIKNILRTRTRFHNNKTRYILQAKQQWLEIKQLLHNPDRKSLRNTLAEEVTGIGYKEAGHFLRNIGKSDNQFAILDRHILRNLQELKVITEKDLHIKNSKHYANIEKRFLAFSQEINIPIDHLDLLFWSKETGKLFK